MDLFVAFGSFIMALAVIKAKEGKRLLSYWLAFGAWLFANYWLLNVSVVIDEILFKILLNALLCFGLVMVGQLLFKPPNR